jgi:hypothetical protein
VLCRAPFCLSLGKIRSADGSAASISLLKHRHDPSLVDVSYDYRLRILSTLGGTSHQLQAAAVLQRRRQQGAP